VTYPIASPRYALGVQPLWLYDHPADTFIWRGRPAPFPYYGGSSVVNCKANVIPPKGLATDEPVDDLGAVADDSRAFPKASKYPLRYLVVPPPTDGGAGRPVRAVAVNKW